MVDLKTTVVDKNLDLLQREIELHVMKSCKATASCLRGLKSYDMAYGLAAVLVNELYQPVMFARIAQGIGEAVWSKYDSPDMPIRKLRDRHFDTGAILLVCAKKLGIVSFIKQKEKNGNSKAKINHPMYFVKPKDIEFLIMLSFHVKADMADSYVKNASFTEPKDYTGFYHPYASGFVHGAHPDARRYISKNNCPLLYRLVNNQMKIPYSVNTEVFSILTKCKGDEIFTRKTENLDKEQRSSIEFRYAQVREEAEKIGDKPFWLYSYLDYRSRFYYCSSYLSPQGTKFAKSLIKFNEKVALGDSGYWSLLVNASNTFGNDKAPMEDRCEFAKINLDEWMKIASDPITYKDWQKADDAFNFLAAILEIKAVHDFSGPTEEFQSNLMIGWDCSNSGLQILSALSRDRVGASQCNLIDTDIRSDFYLFVADKVWKGATKKPTKKEVEFSKIILKEINDLGLKIYNAVVEGDAIAKVEAKAILGAYHEENKSNVDKASRIYWSQPHLYKKRRGIVKRGCMSYFYDCGKITMGSQIAKDFAHESDFEGLNRATASWLGNKIYEVCRVEMPNITAVMNLFKELAGRAAERNEDFSIKLPVTNFMMKQWKQETDVVQKVISITPKKSFNISFAVGKKDKVQKGKAKRAAAANVTHSFDATLLYMILTIADYPLSLVHDCYFSHAGNAGKLLDDSREAFRTLFKEDHLKDICRQHNSMDLYDKLNIGDWSSDEMINNQYCIS